jgi:putative Mn2+ efflux pump MntP
MNAWFFLNSVLLGVGLAMDAFSVSIANGLAEPGMSRKRMCAIAGVYAFFQWAMPVIGWFCVHTISGYFLAFQKFIPWIALILLVWIGGKMLLEGIGKKNSRELAKEEKREEGKRIPAGTLLLQGIATSIDALSVGFTIADYDTAEALLSAFIIAAVTFVICMAGLLFGRKFGEKLSDKAGIFGGIILIAIGVEIFVRGLLGI